MLASAYSSPEEEGAAIILRRRNTDAIFLLFLLPRSSWYSIFTGSAPPRYLDFFLLPLGGPDNSSSTPPSITASVSGARNSPRAFLCNLHPMPYQSLVVPALRDSPLPHHSLPSPAPKNHSSHFCFLNVSPNRRATSLEGTTAPETVDGKKNRVGCWCFWIVITRGSGGNR